MRGTGVHVGVGAQCRGDCKHFLVLGHEWRGCAGVSTLELLLPSSLTLIHGSQQLQYSSVVRCQRKRFPPVCPLFHRGEHDDERCRGGRLTPPPPPPRAFQGKTGTAMMDGRDGELMMEKHGPAMDNGVRLPRNNTISHNVFGNYGVSHARNHFVCL
jgi:hypothetical protein